MQSRKWEKTRLVFDHRALINALPPLSRRARQMRLPTSYKPALTHRSKTAPPRPRSLLPSTPARPPPSADETAADYPTGPSSIIEQPKPRAGISSLLSLPPRPTTAHVGGRPTFSARSTDDHNAAYRRERLPPPPSSPTARSAVSQPAATATAALSGGADSEAARVSLWAELKDVRRRGTRTPGTAREQHPSSP